MKRGLQLSGICALLGAASLCARADDKQPPAPNLQTPAAPAMQPTPIVAPPTASGPYVTPFDSASNDNNSTDPETSALQQIEQVNAQRRESAAIYAFDTAQQQSAYDNDWMLRDYRAALKQEGFDLSPETEGTLVKAPGRSGTASPEIDPLLPPPEDNKPAPRRKSAEDADDNKPLAPMLAPLGMKPLLPPLADANVNKPVRDPWAFNTTQDADNPFADINAPAKTSALPNRDARSSDSLNFLDTPGATAQQDGLIAPDPTEGLASLEDPLPEQDPIRAKKVNSRTNFLVPTAPTNDVTEFFKKQADALNPPTAPNAPVPPVAAKPYVPLKDAFPLAKPVVNPGMHSRIADPFDILHR